MAIKHSLILVENLCLLAVIRQLPEAAAWNITCIYVQYHIGMFMGTCIQVLCRCELLLTWLVVHACCVCLFFFVSSFCMCSATCVCTTWVQSSRMVGVGAGSTRGPPRCSTPTQTCPPITHWIQHLCPLSLPTTCNSSRCKSKDKNRN